MAEIPAANSAEYLQASERLRRNGAREVERETAMAAVLPVWVCPRCGNWYSASGMGDLSAQEKRDSTGHVRGRRDECPTAGCGGIRQLRYARLVPLEEQRAAERQVKAVATAAS